MKEIKINFHYLDKCDMKCKHCFERLNKCSLDKELVKKTFEKLVKVTKAINLVGGETFTERKLLSELIDYGTENHVNLSLVTNGAILLDELDQEYVKSLLRKLKVIGISIDSFDKRTNRKIGRIATEPKTEVLSTNKLRKLKKYCENYGTKVKLNTVVNTFNLNEVMVNKINKIDPDIWKILQVTPLFEDQKISETKFSSFLENNQVDCKTRVETSRDIKSSYLMVNAAGDVFINQSNTGFNIHELPDYKNTSRLLYEKLEEFGFDFNSYFKKYDNVKMDIQFHKNKYHQNFQKLIKNGNVLFFDVESLTPRYNDESKKYLWITSTQLHFLYCGLVVDKNKSITTRFSDSIDPSNNIKTSYDKSKGNTNCYKEFYIKFLMRLKKHKIRSIVVSGKDTETNFFQDMIYYLTDLPRKDFEYLQKLFNNLIDIQLVKRSSYFENLSKKTASRTVLEELHNYRSDIFTYTRANYKGSSTSKDVSEVIGKLFIDSSIPDSEQTLADIRRHCYQDVLDDYEMYSAYELLFRSSVQQETKVCM